MNDIFYIVKIEEDSSIWFETYLNRNRFVVRFFQMDIPPIETKHSHYAIAISSCCATEFDEYLETSPIVVRYSKTRFTKEENNEY